MSVSPPFNPNELVPGDSDTVSQYPAAERTFRDTVESWLLLVSTTAGVSKAMATGAKVPFFMSAVPTYYTQDASQNDKALRVVSGAGGGTGGSWTISGLSTAATGNTETRFEGASPFTTASASHTHVVNSTGAWRPAYIDVVIGTRDAPA